jgi:hypothetical protein
MDTEQYLKRSGAGRPVFNDADWVEKTVGFDLNEVPSWLKLKRGHFNVAPQIKCRLSHITERAGKAYELTFLGSISGCGEWTLVHGETSGPFGHLRMGHAWLERDGWVYDPVLDRIWPWEVYALFTRAVPMRHYSNSEMLGEWAETGHSGPW